MGRRGRGPVTRLPPLPRSHAAASTRAMACLLPALALALLIAPWAIEQGALGQEGPGASDSATDADAYIELLKSSAAYQAMSPEQREAYLAAAHDFITSKGAYEAARNSLLAELANVTLQAQATDDEQRLAELKARYDGLIDELEEYGVGPYNETEANPSHYLNKYEQARERLEGGGAPAGVEEGAAAAAAAAPPGEEKVDYLRSFLDGMAGLYDSLREIIVAALGGHAQGG